MVAALERNGEAIKILQVAFRRIEEKIAEVGERMEQNRAQAKIDKAKRDEHYDRLDERLVRLTRFVYLVPVLVIIGEILKIVHAAQLQALGLQAQPPHL